ncbi:hypothetical protein HID58_013665 [Brassica napus]|uniref:Uncharacterized protein n=1 Tax=Brassica napus TaxID=3708 RepID=A0ABQ8E6R5_BRANA|nr:hypothetical protein HID58_013665 [Brassica napus]
MMRNITCILSKISQRQPPGDKKQLTLIRSKAHATWNPSLTAFGSAGSIHWFLPTLVPSLESPFNDIWFPLAPRGSLHQHQDPWIASPRRHRCIQAHNSASYEKDARFSSGTQHFPVRFTTWTNSKDRRSHKKSSWKYCRSPTTLLPLFPATNPDIPLKEIKVFYPLQTPGETQDPCLSNPQGCTPRQVVRNRNSQALVPRSLKVLKDKSTGPPREVASTPQQRSLFLQGPVTSLRTMYPADECQSSLKHQQVHLRRTLHH